MLQVHMYMSVTLVYNIYVPVAASADLRGQHSGAVAGRNTRGRVCSNSEETAKKRYSKEASQCLYALIWLDKCIDPFLSIRFPWYYWRSSAEAWRSGSVVA